jgi:hypothetical protein
MKSILLLVFATSLFSFTSHYGGDSYQIYLNKKLMLKEYVSMGHAIQSFSLDKNTYDQQVEVYYSHCGRVGTNREIVIKDENNKLVKDLRFADYEGNNSGMSFRVSDFLNWDKKNGTDQLNIYYSSKELPAGRLLATINLTAVNKTQP